VGSRGIKHLTKSGDVQAIDAVALINHEQTNRKSHDLVRQTCALVSMLLHLGPWTLDPGIATAMLKWRCWKGRDSNTPEA